MSMSVGIGVTGDLWILFSLHGRRCCRKWCCIGKERRRRDGVVGRERRRRGGAVGRKRIGVVGREGGSKGAV